jgi:hypothetical protein
MGLADGFALWRTNQPPSTARRQLRGPGRLASLSDTACGHIAAISVSYNKSLNTNSQRSSIITYSNIFWSSHTIRTYPKNDLAIGIYTIGRDGPGNHVCRRGMRQIEVKTSYPTFFRIDPNRLFWPFSRKEWMDC